ncbi:DUF4124 domain-containing protein [Undibacterium sp. SXout11W]|uniref:DUF4124 domain-containing protein n=1 Tax=Undibacterium sp. SXout11W TaxID=3413050 RepID=UPI003BF06DB5
MSISRLLILSTLLLANCAYSQVYKCSSPNGKISFSDTPCSVANQTEKKLSLNVKPSSDVPAPKDWEKENDAFKLRQLDRERQNIQASGKGNLPASTGPQNAIKQLIANCEANHGIGCSKPNVVAQMQRDNTPMTAQEQQRVVGQRRAREREEEFNRAARR